MKLAAADPCFHMIFLPSLAAAADYPAPKPGDWVAHDFKFHTGEAMPELKLHYLTIGDPSGTPVLVLHGTGGSAASMLTPGFVGELFGPEPGARRRKILHHPGRDKPLAAPNRPTRLKAKFPHYDYDDIVDAHYSADRRAGRPSSPAGHRQFDGRDE